MERPNKKCANCKAKSAFVCIENRWLCLDCWKKAIRSRSRCNE